MSSLFNKTVSIQEGQVKTGTQAEGHVKIKVGSGARTSQEH